MLSPKINIIPFQIKHWNPVFAIYQPGFDTGVATFETRAPDWEEWDAKFLKECRIVACSQEDGVMGPQERNHWNRLINYLFPNCSSIDFAEG
jgi:hypothetical protein